MRRKGGRNFHLNPKRPLLAKQPHACGHWPRRCGRRAIESLVNEGRRSRTRSLRGGLFCRRAGILAQAVACAIISAVVQIGWIKIYRAEGPRGGVISLGGVADRIAWRKKTRRPAG